jgi:hypothetical protein
MVSTSTATRRAAARELPRPAPSRPRRPPLPVSTPPPHRSPARRAVRRSTMWLSGFLVVGSLLAVVAGDALVSEGQVRLSTVESQLAAAVVAQKARQVETAEKAAPPVAVSEAKRLGLVPAPQVGYLPYVPLSTPLPVPQTAPLPGQTSASSASASR